jgi:hypothetical protein
LKGFCSKGLYLNGEAFSVGCRDGNPCSNGFCSNGDAFSVGFLGPSRDHIFPEMLVDGKSEKMI